MLKIQKKILTILIILLYFTSTNSYAFILTILKPLGFIAAAIADRVTSVQVIQANGITAHNYSLCPLDIIKIKNADFLISIGNNTELLFLNKIIQSFKKKYRTEFY